MNQSKITHYYIWGNAAFPLPHSSPQYFMHSTQYWGGMYPTTPNPESVPVGSEKLQLGARGKYLCLRHLPDPPGV